MCIVISFGILYPFSTHGVEVNPLAPSIMMFVSMALSIDYSMFMLSRFASERRAGNTVDDSVRGMLRYSAHVVLLSGVILMICYMSIVVVPVNGLETIGWGAAIAILCCILINITFSTATILAFPNFYGELEAFPSCCIRHCARICTKCPCPLCSRCSEYQDYGLDSHSKELAVSMMKDEDVMAVVDEESEVSPQNITGTDTISPPTPDDVHYSIGGAIIGAVDDMNRRVSTSVPSVVKETEDEFGGNSPVLGAGPRSIPVVVPSTGSLTRYHELWIHDWSLIVSSICSICVEFVCFFVICHVIRINELQYQRHLETQCIESIQCEKFSI